jgi:ATP-dependent RNA helicase DeaD
MKFEEVNFTEETKRALADIGYVEMTEIQEKSIPVILKGKDVIGQSKTGTGKTASYGLPIIEMIDSEDRNIQAIILCPTRELATQVTAEIRKFMKYKDSIKTVCVYGGQSIESQIREIKRGAQIIVGTPGRIMDHMRRGTIKLNSTKIAVLDEADEMLDMGFEEDMETILNAIGDDRQTLLFSATMSTRILNIAKKYLKDPTNIKIKAQELTVNGIKQIAIEMKNAMKDEAVMRILDAYDPKKAIIFCNTKKKVDNLIDILQQNGYSADCIHGDKSQDLRSRIMKKFKQGDLKILIATDVAARGIDVEDLDIVINYDIPQETEYYVHRIGRTGRNGKEGIAFTFFGGKEKNKIVNIEKYSKSKLKIDKLPTIAEISKIKNQKLIKQIKEEIDKEDNEENNNKEEKELKISLFKSLMKEYEDDYEKVAKSLFSIIMKNGVNNKKTEQKNKEIDTNVDACIDEDGNVKLFLNLGKRDKIMVKDIVGSITANTALSGKDIGNIKLLDNFSFVSVPKEYVNEVVNGMHGKPIKGKESNFEVARN